MSEFERLTTQSEVFDGVTLKGLCESCGESGCNDFCEDLQDKECKGCPVQEAFQRLSAYEDSELSPSEVTDIKALAQKMNVCDLVQGNLNLFNVIRHLEADNELLRVELSDLTKAKEEGRLVILPSKSDEIIRIVELALRIKLYDWQKAYITGVSGYVMPGRVSGKTTAYMIKLCLSEGDLIDLTKRKEIERYADGIHGSQYLDYFKHELWNIYLELKRVGGLERRKIYFSERDKHDRR